MVKISFSSPAVCLIQCSRNCQERLLLCHVWKKAVEESQKRKSHVCSDSFKILPVCCQLCCWHGPSLRIFVFSLTLRGGCQRFPGEIRVRNSIHSLYLRIRKKIIRERKSPLYTVCFVCQIALVRYKWRRVWSPQGAKHARALVQCFLAAGTVCRIHHVTAVPLAKRLS